MAACCSGPRHVGRTETRADAPGGQERGPQPLRWVGLCPPQGTTTIPSGVGLCHPHGTLHFVSTWGSYACAHVCKGVGDMWPSPPHRPCRRGLTPQTARASRCLGLRTLRRHGAASTPHVGASSLLQNRTEQSAWACPGSRALGTQLQVGRAGCMGTRGPQGAVHARRWGHRGQSRLASAQDGDSRSKTTAGNEVSEGGVRRWCWKAALAGAASRTLFAWQ